MIRAARLYIHHVGLSGAQADFPKTVDRQVAIEDICREVSDDERRRVQTLEALARLFPSGRCSCWGVPAQASFVMRNLSAGDYVLLVRTTRDEGDIPVLCWVKYVLPFPSHELSMALWQSNRYALIFFFDTEEIVLTWQAFCQDMAYERYDPRGCFRSVSDAKLARYGGAKGYISYLRHQRSGGVINLRARSEGEDRMVSEEVSAPTSWSVPPSGDETGSSSFLEWQTSDGWTA